MSLDKKGFLRLGPFHHVKLVLKAWFAVRLNADHRVKHDKSSLLNARGGFEAAKMADAQSHLHADNAKALAEHWPAHHVNYAWAVAAL